jgi:outer membrane protein TolC
VGAEEIALQAALELARASNPALAAAHRRAEAAAGEAAAAARSASWPRLALASDWTATDQPSAVFARRLDAGTLATRDLAPDRLSSPEPYSHLGTALALEVPIDLSGRAGAQRLDADARSRVASAALRDAELETDLQVSAAWHRALVAAQAVAATEQTLAGSLAREAELDARQSEGAALQADLLRAKARRRRLEAELASRRGERSTARAALALAVGSERPLEPAGAPAVPMPPGELAPWLVAAGDAAAVAAARAAAEAAAARETAELRGARPDVLLSAQLRDDRGPLDEGQESWAGGAMLRWSLFDPQRASRRTAASSARAAAEADLEAVLARARFATEAAWHAAAATHERWLAARGGTEEGREALRVVRERRGAGLATLTDELETEAAALAAELDELAAAAEAAIARAALVRAAGRPAMENSP